MASTNKKIKKLTEKVEFLQMQLDDYNEESNLDFRLKRSKEQAFNKGIKIMKVQVLIIVFVYFMIEIFEKIF